MGPFKPKTCHYLFFENFVDIKSDVKLLLGKSFYQLMLSMEFVVVKFTAQFFACFFNFLSSAHIKELFYVFTSLCTKHKYVK